MTEVTMITMGGFFHLAFAAFHLLFWKLFKWPEDLKSLGFVNRQIIQILNLRLTYIFLLLAYLSLVHAKELLSTSLGKTLLVGISIFWFMRAAEQVFFFGVKHPASLGVFVAFLAGGVIYGLPAVSF